MTAAQAQRAFSNHEILFCGRTERTLSYTIGRPGSSEYSTTITAGTHRCLLVYGDIDTVAFQFGPANLDARMHWLADEKCSRYTLEKASIGMGGRDLLREWDQHKARRDIDELADLHAEDSSPGSLVHDIREIGQDITSESLRMDVLRDLSKIGVESEYLGHVGMVHAPRIIYAHAAIRKLSELLKEREH